MYSRICRCRGVSSRSAMPAAPPFCVAPGPGRRCHRNTPVRLLQTSVREVGPSPYATWDDRGLTSAQMFVILRTELRRTGIRCSESEGARRMATQRARPASAHEETSAGAVAAGRRAMAGGVAGVVLLLLLGSASLALGWWWTVSRSTEVASAMPAIQGRAELRRVAVQPGDTLWE